MAELLIGLLIFIIISSGAVFLILGSFKSNLQSHDYNQAVLVNEEAFSAAQAVGNKRWADLICTTTSLTLDTDANNNWRIKSCLDNCCSGSCADNRCSTIENPACYSRNLLGKYNRWVSIYGLFRDPNGQLTTNTTTIGASGHGELNYFENNMRLVIATTTWPTLAGINTNTIVQKRYISNWHGVSFNQSTNNFGPLGSDDNNVAINPAGDLQLSGTSGNYASQGEYISPIFNTQSDYPAYDFLSWQTGWSN